MSVGFIRSNVVRKVVSAVCLLTFPAVAQQANTGLSMQATPGTNQQPAANSSQQSTPSSDAGQQSAAPAPQQGGQSQPGKPPLPEAPQVKKLPEPTHVDYSKPAPLLPNPFARYIPRDVPAPAFTNAPNIEQLVQNGKLMLSFNCPGR